MFFETLCYIDDYLQVSEITSRTALLQWSTPPQLENPQDLNYEVLLSDRGKDGKYKSIYSGEALSCRWEYKKEIMIKMMKTILFINKLMIL